jgi:hypothetical protein
MTFQTRKEYMAERARVICELAATKTLGEIIAEVDVGYETVKKVLRDNGLRAVRKTRTQKNTCEERNQAWIKAYEDGTSNASQLAKEAGVSRERVCQILRPHKVIEKRAERRKKVQEAMSEEFERLKQETKENQRKKFEPGFELVRQGQSFSGAALSIGITAMQEQRVFIIACKALGLKMHTSRWADFSDRRRRCEELSAQGHSVASMVKLMRANGDPKVHENWVYANLPHLRKGRTARPKPPKPPKPDIESIWTAERIDLLRRSWKDGLSAQHIADLLGTGFTRNSVIGKANRLRAAGQLFISETA